MCSPTYGNGTLRFDFRITGESTSNTKEGTTLDISDGVELEFTDLEGPMLARVVLDINKTAAIHSLVLGDPAKQFLFNLVCPEGEASLGGKITASRWKQMELPSEDFKPNTFQPTIEFRADIFTYNIPERKIEENRVEFHVNFADANLFGFYGSSLFAQDEMQVAEHPSLCVLREYLLSSGHQNLGPYCRGVREATPWIVMGAERVCSISTNPNAAEGRPRGLYGHEFARATHRAIRSGTKILDPPTISNIIAMVAPRGGGQYTMSQINEIIGTAYTSFVAAKNEAYLDSGYWKDISGTIADSTKKPKVVIHTGNWGTGAFGGNRTIMAILQVAAARMAKIDELIYHTVTTCREAEKAQELLREKMLPPEERVSVSEFLSRVENQKFMWGFSNHT